MTCNCDRRPEWRLREERVIVDVESVDWSQHPAWSSDFSASEMEVESMDAVPSWAGDPVAVQRVYVCETCGRRMTRREPLPEAKAGDD